MSKQNEKKKILIQLDPDKQPSVFDRVVAIDAGVDHIFAYGEVAPDNVEALVHGAMFTRGPKDLHNTAIFVGGSDVKQSEALLEKIKNTFFVPLQVSVLFDANGANTTAVAAILTAAKHLNFKEIKALVLGGTGPVGQRAARLLSNEGAHVFLSSRSMERATSASQGINEASENQLVEPVAPQDKEELLGIIKKVDLVISAGKAGVCLLPQEVIDKTNNLKVAIDLNAVPPSGIEIINPQDCGKDKDGITCYGAIGVGGMKMKIHKAAVQRLFETNDVVLDAEGIYDLGKALT